jgi:trimethylamine--corrinoid protein Co-methyltransferase
LKLARLEVLSKDELLIIHQSSLEILSKIGISVSSESAIKLLQSAGCSVDFKTNIVKIPEQVLNEAIERAPSSITLYDRDLRAPCYLGGDNTYAWSGNVGTFVLTSGSGERRPAIVQDVAQFARLADALENIQVVGVQVVPQDVKGPAGEVLAAREMFANTSKHIFVCHSEPSVARTQFDMARAVLQGKELAKYPIMTSLVDPTSPLSWNRGSVEALIENAKAGVPCIIASCPISGGTAPTSLAGTLVVQNAEILSGVLISQLENPGTPVIYGTAAVIMDMHQGSAVIGTPETVLLRIAVAQLGRFYNLPTESIGPDSDSHCMDEQNAWEKMITASAVISSRANILMNAGMFASGLTVSYEQLVIDNEILGYLFHLRNGIEVTPETLAIKHIQETGPGGHFLRGDLQFAWRRLEEEYWMPDISCRMAYNTWINRGGRESMASARERTHQILEKHRPAELNSATNRRLEEIAAAFKGATS